MAASMGAALAGVDFTCHPYTPGGQVRIPAASRTDAAVAAVEAFFDQPPLRLRQTQICPGLGAFLPFFLDLPDMRCQLIPARRLAGLSGRRAQVPPSICTCTADFRNRSYEVCN